MSAKREYSARSLCATVLLLTLGAWTAEAELVTYQKGDGKLAVSETDDTAIDATVPDTTWVDDGQDITHFENDLDPLRHGLVKFPNIFGSGTDQIPLGSLILSATLTLEIDNEGTDCPSMYQLVEDWTESEATWNSRSTGVSWSTPGAGLPSHTGVLEAVVPCTVVGTVNLDVTSSVQNWSDGELNAGWVFIPGSPSTNGVNYRSSEHATAADRPMLTVNFLPEVFYSVGTNAADLKTGSPSITIASGVATLDVAQTKNIGVGDVIDHDTDNKLVYIWDVVSPTEFHVQKGDGTVPADVSGVTVNSIKRAFNSVAAAVTGSAAKLGNTDLTVAGRKLTWICYNDGPLNVSATTAITGFTTDATHFITLTVAGASQVATGNSQRHRGTAGSGVRLEATAGGISFLSVAESYTRIEWLELDGNDISTTEGILLQGSADNSLVRNTIVHHLVGTPGSETVTSSGIYIDTGNVSSEVWNAFIYSFDGDGVHVSGTNAVVANSTFYEGRTAPSSNSVQTDTGATATVYNVLAVGPETDFWENDAPGLSLYNCISEDNSAQTYDVSGSFKIGVDESTEFVSVAGAIDLHLRAGAEAIDFGTDLSASFTNDIDDHTRFFGSGWDVGADETPASAATVNYRSIGSAAPLVDEGTITVTAGSPVVTKTGGLGWLTQNRGRGDVLILPGPVVYVIEAVISDNELRLGSLPSADYNAGVYTIDRQHDDLYTWWDCVSNAAPCPYFPVASPDLVADDRSEIGIAYKDSPFVLTADVSLNDTTTDASHTILLTADPGNRHNGTAGAGVIVDADQKDYEFIIRDDYITVEWLEFKGCKGADALSPIEVWGSDGPPVDVATNVVLQNLLIHDFDDTTPGFNNSGIDLTGSNTLEGKTVTIRNVMIWDGDQRGIEGDEPLDVAIIENVSIDEMEENGIWADTSSFIVRNSIVTTTNLLTAGDYSAGSGSLVGSYNTSSDTTASTYFAIGFQDNVAATDVFIDPANDDLHLKAGINPAVDTGTDLSSSFVNDIDDQFRPRAAPWDRGADERDATTAVKLVSFEASALEGAVDLSWETSSELDNLGFHLYRGTASDSAYERITTWPIPGLGSSPVGARFSYRDSGLVNGVAYYYKLEDIETTGARQMHGPVSAIPGSVAAPVEEESGLPESSPVDSGSRIVYGDPSANSLEILKRGRNRIVLELVTKGFYAEPLEDGSVRLTVPGFDSPYEPGEPEVPVKRTWVEAVAGRKVELASVKARGVQAFTTLRPTDAEVTEIVQSVEGTVRTRRRRAAAAFRGDGLYPSSTANIASVGFQGDVKKALVELAPLRWDAATGELLLARRLVVKISFAGREPSELSAGGAIGRGYVKPPSHDRRNVVARLVARKRGLYGVRFEDAMRGRRGVRAKTLRLSRQGKPVAFHIEPASHRFGPGSTLYFVSGGGASNPYGTEAVYELEVGSSAEMMQEASAAPSGEPTRYYRRDAAWEENLYYQAALVEAPDVWLWDALFAPETKRYSFELTSVATSNESAKLSVFLQGVSDFQANPDHHVRVRVNGSSVADVHWDGKKPERVDAELLPGLLMEGENVLEIENVGDTAASYSMVMLDRFAVRYPRLPVAEDGQLEGSWAESGIAEIVGAGTDPFLLDVTDDTPRWLTGGGARANGSTSFHAEASRNYLVVSRDAVLSSEVRKPSSSRLKRNRNRADYLVIGPAAFLDEAVPLLDLRRSHGLRVKAVPLEEVFDEFGFGEATPLAIRDFLSYAYHRWREPSPRYVVLLGDATFDFEDRLQTGVVNRVPPLMVKTSYLWTVSDPALAAVNGDDLLPDLAIGRLPAANEEEARAMVEKIVAYENDAGTSLFRAPAVLVADDSDEAGDFEGDADEIAASPLSGRSVEKIYLSELGAARTRAAIIEAFDRGASLMSYLGHGGIALWADENVLNIGDSGSLSTERQQPLLLTMNCLNGYFHFPYFDSLGESMLKMEGKGAIAAFSPSGLSVNRFAQRFHEALLVALFSGSHERLGDAVLAAQSAYAETGAYPELLTIYHLLGDPALRLR